MFASYLTNSVYPGDATKYSMFPCMPMFTPQGPISPPISTSASPSPSNTSSASDEAEMNVHDCSSGYSSLDESWATLNPSLEMYQLRRLAYSPPYFPFWYRQWSPPLVTTGNVEISPSSMDKKIISACSTPTTTVEIPSQRQQIRLKSQRSVMLLEMTVDLLSNVNNANIIEWISTKSPEFKIRDRKKFMSHWNRVSGKQDSFMAIACKLRGVGNEKMQTTDGQKIRLITRTAPYTYRFLPDHETSSFPMLHDHILQQLVTKMLLSFHLHQRKCKNDAESAAFCH